MALSAAIVLSGLPREQFTGNLECLFDRGAILLRNPDVSSPKKVVKKFAPISTNECTTPAENNEKILGYYLDVIAKLEERFELLSDRPRGNYIRYQKRNLLDLGRNVKSEWPFQPSILKKGVSNFFQNRSQISRVDDNPLPRHIVAQCKEEDCTFRHYVYF